MNKKIKARWIRALRSGKYVQGKSSLHRIGNTSRFCCLGVLCEIAVKDGIVKFDDDYDDDYKDMYRYYGTGIDRDSTLLPNKVMKWAGLKSNNGVFGDDANDTLSNENDRGASFSDIANLIQKYL